MPRRRITHPYSSHGDLAVAAASSDQLLIAGYQRIGSFTNRFPYVAAPNISLQKNCLPSIELAFPGQPNAAQINQFADYLALSTSVHLFAGWRYLSQATSSYISGAKHQALHLAYYAELRAAMAILAESGIAILNHIHFTMDAAGTVHWFEGSTHEVAWLALKKWKTLSSATKKITDNLAYEGLTATQWATLFSNSAVPPNLLVQQWIDKWSIDLSLVGSDRNSRNIASYRPNLQPDAYSALAKTDLEFVCKIGRSFQLGTGYFDSIDRAIIFHLAKRMVETSEGSFSKSKKRKFRNDLIRKLVDVQGFSEAEAAFLANNLIRAHESDGFQLLRQAEPTRSDAAAVISRAVFLLRLASAIVKGQWREIEQQNAMSGYPNSLNWQDDLLFEVSKSTNLWFDDLNPPPGGDYSILADDQLDALDVIETWLRINAFDRERSLLDLGLSLQQLIRFDRVGVMSLAK